MKSVDVSAFAQGRNLSDSKEELLYFSLDIVLSLLVCDSALRWSMGSKRKYKLLLIGGSEIESTFQVNPHL